MRKNLATIGAVLFAISFFSVEPQATILMWIGVGCYLAAVFRRVPDKQD